MLLNHETELNLHQMPINLEGGYLDEQIALIPKGKRRIFHTHLPYQLLPKSAKNNPNLKIVLMTRSPLSTVTSFYHFLKDFHNVSDAAQIFDGNFDLFFRRWIEGKLYFGDWFQFHQDYWENLVKPAARAPSVVSPDSDSSPSSSSSSSSPFSSPSSSPSFSPGCRTRCCQPSPSKRLKKTVTPPSKAQLRQTANLTLRLNGQTGRVLREVSNITRDISTDSRCYHLSFENLKDNFVGAMAGLANFLQCSQSTQFYQEIQDATKIEKMRDWCQIKQQEKVLAWPMCRLYRTGSKTDWKKLMTRKQVELVRKLCCARLRECEPIFRDEQFLKSYPNKEGIEEEVLAPRFP